MPCTNGDAGHCGTNYSRSIPKLPAWGTFEKVFLLANASRFARVRSYIGNHGAGRWWLDDFRIRRLDSALLNVVRVNGSTDVTLVSDVSDGAGKRGKPVQYEIGKDFTVLDPVTPLDSTGENFSALQPTVIKRVSGGAIPTAEVRSAMR